jgi:hypothetical protein
MSNFGNLYECDVRKIVQHIMDDALLNYSVRIKL